MPRRKLLPTYNALAANYPKGSPELAKATIGGNINMGWVTNTCAVRVSHSLNLAAHAIPSTFASWKPGQFSARGGNKMHYIFKVRAKPIRRLLRPDTIAAVDRIDLPKPLEWPCCEWSFGFAFQRIVVDAGLERGWFRWLRRSAGSLVEAENPGAGCKALGNQYVSLRRKARGLKPGSKISAATIRKDIRVLLAALGIAKRWKYIQNVPAKPKVKGIETDKRFVTEEHFDAMLNALDAKPCPVSYPFSGDYGGTWTPAQWWTAFLVLAWVTGMRRSALLALRWEDVNLETGEAVSRGIDNKGRRDGIVKIGAAVELLRSLKSDDPRVFPWDHADTWMDHELMAIQQAAGIHLACTGSDSHECTPKCHLYSLHDFRRAHATYHYGRVSDREPQRQMGHASFQTTRSYAKYAEAHKHTPYDVHLPTLAKAKAQGLKLTRHDSWQDGGQTADKSRKGAATA